MLIKQLNFKDRLFDINLQIPQKGLVAVIGPNGAGKSTLLKNLAGIYQPDSGQVFVVNYNNYNNYDKTVSNHIIHQCDINLLQLSSLERCTYLSYLAQNAPIHWDIDVHSLIKLGLINQLISEEQIESNMKEICSYLNLNSFINRSVMTLSGGELARVHLARAVVAQCPILLVDEPIASLDPFYQLEILEYLHNLSQDKLVIIVLHDLVLASRYADYFILMTQGRVAASGLKQQVLTNDHLNSIFKVTVLLDNQCQVIGISRTPE